LEKILAGRRQEKYISIELVKGEDFHIESGGPVLERFYEN
jgi:hypothetical protein